MSFGMRMRQMQCFECSLCGQLLDDQKRCDDATNVAFFGAVEYAVCPICYAPNQPKDDPEWIKKVDEWAKNH